MTILFHLLLDQLWFQLHNSGLVGKLGCYTFFPENFRVLDYVSRLHQADLSKSCKHWDIFLSHCRNGDGTYETIPKNTGIRCFVWEHLQNLNRVVQWMKYCGGTFSGPKTTLCAAEITVVGHRCTYDRRLPETDWVGVIKQWSACNNVSEVQMFLGTIGVCRVFCYDLWTKRELNRLYSRSVLSKYNY